MPRACTPADYAQTGLVLKTAFDDDPTFGALFNRQQWESFGETFMRYLCWCLSASYGMTDVIEQGGGIGCAALWEPPTQSIGALVRFVFAFIFMLSNLGFSFTWRMIKMFMILEERRLHHAPAAHHLNVLGTDAAMQGKGLGSKVIRVGIARADAEGVPCYLESSNPRNVPFYQRHGFVVIEEIYPLKDDAAVPGDGPVTTLMRREVTKKAE